MKFILRPLKELYASLSKFVHERWALLFPAWYAKYIYKKITHKRLNLKNPKDFQEKNQWLKVYSDTSQWTDLADKYKVRDYVTQCGLGDTLVKLYGVWERAEDIDFNALPEKFVLKTNHGFRRVILVEDKSKLDIPKTVKKLNTWVKERYGLLSFEPHYWNIERRIIAEEFLEDHSRKDISSSLIDYKFFCYNGEPEVILCLFDRKYFGEDMSTGSNMEVEHVAPKFQLYDLDWNPRPEYSFLDNDPEFNSVPAPSQLKEMIRVCRILGKSFPMVRIDLYEVNNKVYFGELTFTHGGGSNEFFTDEYAIKMGDKIDLSAIDRKKRRSII